MSVVSAVARRMHAQHVADRDQFLERSASPVHRRAISMPDGRYGIVERDLACRSRAPASRRPSPMRPMPTTPNDRAAQAPHRRRRVEAPARAGIGPQGIVIGRGAPRQGQHQGDARGRPPPTCRSRARCRPATPPPPPGREIDRCRYPTPSRTSTLQRRIIRTAPVHSRCPAEYWMIAVGDPAHSSGRTGPDGSSDGRAAWPRPRQVDAPRSRRHR